MASRIRSSFARGTEALFQVAESERLLLTTYDICLPQCDPLPPGPITQDENAVTFIQLFRPSLLEHVIPLAVDGDGNCLYRAVSRALYATEDAHLHLRLISTLEIALHPGCYDSKANGYMDLIGDNRVVTSCYKDLLLHAATPGCESEMLHVYALSSALGLPIRTFCPSTHQNWHYLGDPMTRKVCGRDVTSDDSSTPTIMWTQTLPAQTLERFQPNHFAVLHPRKTFNDDQFDDLCSRIPDHVEQRATYSPSRGSPPFSPVPPCAPPSAPSSPASTMHQEDESIPSDNKPTGGIPLPGGNFLQIHTVLRHLQQNTELPIHARIPPGRKEDMFFLLDNSTTKGQPCNAIWDDCGAWKTQGPSPKTAYIKGSDGQLKTVVYKDKTYYMEKRQNGKKILVPMDPQPEEGNVIRVQRSYRKHAQATDYERRATWVISGNEERLLVCVEYKGKFPGVAPHGKREKNSDPYIRTRPDVMHRIKVESKTHTPKTAFDNVAKSAAMDHDYYAMPKSTEQVKQARHRVKKRESQIPGASSNFADNMQQLVSMVQTGHIFARRVTFNGLNKVPSVMLYTDAQIADIKRFCCQPIHGTVLGFDKTFNLGDVHVTLGVFKHLGVTRKDTGTYPIFPGPIFLHGNSDVTTYMDFFSHLSTLLEGSPSTPVFGSDNEQALVNAISRAFPQSHRINCTRHLRTNMTDYLKDTAGMPSEMRQKISQSIFGPNGIVHAKTRGLFDIRVHITQEIIEETSSDQALQYFETRLLPHLSQNLKTAMEHPFCSTNWSNNNCESFNHVLKQQIDWKPRPLLTLVNMLKDVVEHAYRNIELSMIGIGDYQLIDAFQGFACSMETWSNKLSQTQRDRHLKRFNTTPVPCQKHIMSSDSKLTVTRPTGGKKPGQRKRKRMAKTPSGTFM